MGIGILILVVAIGFGLMFECIRFNIMLEKKAKESIKNFKKFHSTNLNYLDFIKIENRNPGWLSYGPNYQSELLSKYGADTLKYSYCNY